VPYAPSHPAGDFAVLLDLARAISFFVTILSLLALFNTAFFEIGATWQERLFGAIAHVGMAAGIAFASGLLFRYSTHPTISLTKTLPVRTFLWTLFGIIILFALAWYLDVYYMPLARRVLSLYVSGKFQLG
jgi:hypothetical protein